MSFLTYLFLFSSCKKSFGTLTPLILDIRETDSICTYSPFVKKGTVSIVVTNGLINITTERTFNWKIECDYKNGTFCGKTKEAAIQEAIGYIKIYYMDYKVQKIKFSRKILNLIENDIKRNKVVVKSKGDTIDVDWIINTAVMSSFF